VKLTNEFTVAAEPDTVWKALLDMEGVAGCLPGATIEATDQENHYKGSMKVKIGPMTVAYQGTATLSEVNEETRRAVISLSAREAKGQGTALATITNLVEEHDGGTRVRAETDLRITGAQARFGRGVMEDVAGRVLRDFSSCLERQVTGPAEPEAPPVEAAAAVRPAPAEAPPMEAAAAERPAPAEAPPVEAAAAEQFAPAEAPQVEAAAAEQPAPAEAAQVEAPAAEQPAPAGGDEAGRAGGDVLDVGALLSGTKAARYARVGLPLLAALGAAVLLLLRRRR
jgi:carbon monoxide dehydrogenase subunit G